MPQRIYWQKDYVKYYKRKNIGQELSEFTPVEIVGYEVDEAGSPTSFSLWVVHIYGGLFIYGKS